MSTRIRITNTSKQPQDIGGRWLQPGGSDVFDLEQVPPEWRAAGVLVDVPDARAGEIERVGDALYVRKADGSRNVLVEAATTPGGGNRLSVAGQRIQTLNPRWWQHAQPQAIRRPLLTPGADAVEQYSAQGGTMSVVPALDTTFGGSAVELLCPAGGASVKAAGVDVQIDADLTLDDVIVMHLYVPPDREGYYNISGWLYQAGKTNARSATFETSALVMLPGVGHVAFARRLSEFTGGSGPLPAAGEYQNYKWLRLQANATAGTPESRLQVLHVEVVRGRTPMVCLTADDNQLSQKDIGARVFNSYGIPMTLFVMTDSPSSGSADHMTWDDLAWMTARGNVVCNHTTSHLRADPAFATVDQWAASVESARDVLISRGYEIGANHFAWCNGARSAPYIERAKKIGLLTARNLNARGINGSYGIPSPLDLPGILQTDRTAAQILADVDAITARGADCTIVTHSFHETTNAGQDMSRAEATTLAKGLRERAEAGTIIVGTVPELWARRQAEAGWSPEV